MLIRKLNLFIIHDLLFLPISILHNRVLEYSRGLFTLEWTHPVDYAHRRECGQTTTAWSWIKL